MFKNASVFCSGREVNLMNFNFDKNLVKNINVYVFSIVAVLHLWRAITGLPLNIGVMDIPVWGSYLAVLVTSFLAYLNYHA